MQLLSRKKPLLPQGTFMGVFVAWYGIARILVEFVRVPDAQLGDILGGVITMGQLLRPAARAHSGSAHRLRSACQAPPRAPILHTRRPFHIEQLARLRHLCRGGPFFSCEAGLFLCGKRQ